MSGWLASDAKHYLDVVYVLFPKGITIKSEKNTNLFMFLSNAHPNKRRHRYKENKGSQISNTLLCIRPFDKQSYTHLGKQNKAN